MIWVRLTLFWTLTLVFPAQADPEWSSIPDIPPIHDPGPPHQQSGGTQQANQPSNTPPESNKPDRPGKPRPDQCYEGEGAGECAARIVQDRVAGFQVWLVGTAVAQAFAALLSMGVIILQAWITFQQLRAAKDAAAAALVSANMAKATLESATRPFVHISKWTYGFYFDDANNGKLTDFHFVPLITNTGNSFTQNSNLCTSWCFLTGPLPPDFSYPDICRNTQHPQRVTLHPGQTLRGHRATVPSDLIIAAWETRKATHEKRQHVFIWGWIDYDAPIPNSPRHRFEFGMEVVFRDDPMAGKPEHMDLRIQGPHNGADGECYRQPGDPRPSYKAHSGPRQDLPPDHPENCR